MSGCVATIDLYDVKEASNHTWHKMNFPDRDSSYGYICTNKNRKRMRLHHLLIGRPPSGFMVDHINGKSQDNRRSNLRFITRAMNKANSSKSRGYYPYFGKWVAKIRVDKRLLHLGTFTNEEDAKKARLKAEKYYFGEFAPRRPGNV